MRLLFAENHADFARVVVKEFLAAHSVTTVPGVKTAIAAFKNGEFDAVLVDYDLDDGKGDELVARIRVEYPRMPIIAVPSQSGSGSSTR